MLGTERLTTLLGSGGAKAVPSTKDPEERQTELNAE